jgi:hypothetical protein
MTAQYKLIGEWFEDELHGIALREMRYDLVGDN